MDQTLTAQEATMQTLRHHFNHKARPATPIDFVIYWALFVTLLELCREAGCALPYDLPPPPRPR